MGIPMFIKTEIVKGKPIGMIVISEMILVLLVKANGLLHSQ